MRLADRICLNGFAEEIGQGSENLEEERPMFDAHLGLRGICGWAGEEPMDRFGR